MFRTLAVQWNYQACGHCRVPILPDGYIRSTTSKQYPVWLESTIEAWCAEREAAERAE